MKSKEYKLKSASSNKTLIVPASVIDKMGSAGENDLKALLYILEYQRRNPAADSFDSETLKTVFKEGADFDSAIAFWRGAGIISASSVQKEEAIAPEKEESVPQKRQADDRRPAYTASQLADAAEKDSGFKALADFVGDKLGRMLNTSDLALLYSFGDYLKMPRDVVMIVVEYCALEGKNSLRYVEKVLISFADDEINTYSKAEKHIKKLRQRKSFEGKVRKLCGLGERSLTQKEKEYLKIWHEEYKYGEEMIKAAYEKTIAGIQKPSLSYMNSILKNWHEAGFKKLSDVNGEKPSESGSASFDLDEFFEAAVESSRKKVKK